jgi:hypothetical protein
MVLGGSDYARRVTRSSLADRAPRVACAALLSLALVVTTPSLARAEPTAVSVYNDGAAGPGTQLATFFTDGEPLAYVDWLCLEADHDEGPALDVTLARLSVLDEDGGALGHFTSASGLQHRFRAFPASAPAESGARVRYCTRVLPRAWSEDAVRFVLDHQRDASRTTRVTFAIDNDARGCSGHACGTLTPRFTGFTYGTSAARFSYGSVGFWRGSSFEHGGLGDGVTRLRVAAFVPLLYITAGSPSSLRLSAQAGLALPVTLASTSLEGGGSALGAGAGAYWAQCLDLRVTLAPRLCLGAEIDGAVEGALRGGALDDVRPRAVLSWFVALGIGPR